MDISEQSQKISLTELQNSDETNSNINKVSADTWSDFLATFGTWQDSLPVEETLSDIHEGRRSKSEPVSL